MKYIELKPLGIREGEEEWKLSNYPGPGAYLLPSGTVAIAYGYPLMVTMLPPGTAEIRTSDGRQGVDVHRLFDQLIELKKT